MNPWKTLNIDPTDDKKVIKKAYACLIKQFKPDEHPEKFQEIQEAYQYALQTLKWNKQEAENYQEILKINSPIKIQKRKQDDFSLSNEQKKIERTINVCIDGILKQKYLFINSIENWHFIEKYYDIESLQLKQSVSENVFQNIAQINIDFQNRNNRNLLDDKILKYLNLVFEWELQLNHFENIFSYEQINAVCSYVDNKNTEHIRPIRFWKRTWIVFGEFGLIALFAKILTFFVKLDKTFAFSLFILFFIFSRLIIELYNRQASLGKIVDDAIVMNEYGERTSRTIILIRHIIVHISLSPIYYMWNSEAKTFNIYWLICVSLIMILHIIPFIKYKLLFHDYVTKTMVVWKVVYRKSKK